MVFAIGVFGDRFLGMLNTCLYSISANAKGNQVFIFWQNINTPVFLAIKNAYPEVVFVETKFNLEERFTRRGSKMLFWEAAAETLIDRGFVNACFMDVDTLVLKDINHLFEAEFDVGFSIKKEIWPLNTGVFLVKLKPGALAFMKSWRTKAMINIRNPDSYSQAKSKDYPYGGPDQMAFHQMLSFIPVQSRYEIDDLHFQGYESEIFNETRSTNVSEETHIIHYKGGWQKVLIDGGVFSKKRTLSDSQEMYILYMRTAEEALKHLNKVNRTKFSSDQVGISKPQYLTESFDINKVLYKQKVVWTRLTSLRQQFTTTLKKKFSIIGSKGKKRD